ncbi:hypothetical protein R2103_03455 [Nitrosomonas sp. Is24]|uniref:hypothetical protein n=1 Tax=Nitrosomonas sp. Is24 TaxID=3080533 RepID=UPI00294AF04C|nr:hypothetical protein [Nitrosomonas sp. Is24]MDV6340824.1 hypothetical protein [Nitrosomonas sp. Is24]
MNINNQALQASSFPVLIIKQLHIEKSNANCFARRGVNMVFINMLLLLTALSFVTPAAYAASLLFKSNLGSGVSLGAPYNFSAHGAYQMINGTDKETGYMWPVSALGSNFSGVQLITVDPITSSTIGNYISSQIRSVTGPKGGAVNELFQQVKITGELGRAGSQAPLLIQRPWTIGDVKDLYITYWFKYQADLETQLDNTVSSANWRTQFSLKTGGYNNTGEGDYRMSVTVMKGADGKLYWMTKGDNVGGVFPTRVDYWREDNHIVPVPIDKWFKFEVYWHRSSGTDGRFWAAVDGEVIADYHGPNMGDYNLPITRIFVSNPYSGGHTSVDNHITGLEIWNGFPCGDGVSCLNFDTVAPTVPASLASKLSNYGTASGVALSWSKSSDNVAVAGYKIYRNGTNIGVTTTATSFRDVIMGSAKGALYSYTVRAFDAAENLSAASTATLVTY